MPTRTRHSRMTSGSSIDGFLGRLVRYELPWDQAWEADFRAFSERFTFHDSKWIGVFLLPQEGNEAVLAFEWDAHWLPEPLRSEGCVDESAPPLDKWPLLFVFVPDLLSVCLSGYERPMSSR